MSHDPRANPKGFKKLAGELSAATPPVTSTPNDPHPGGVPERAHDTQMARVAFNAVRAGIRALWHPFGMGMPIFNVTRITRCACPARMTLDFISTPSSKVAPP